MSRAKKFWADTRAMIGPLEAVDRRNQGDFFILGH